MGSTRYSKDSFSENAIPKTVILTPITGIYQKG